ncbi:hypothetical protein L209DRAFT_757996, partial [Thermothelomyces heterothallicus CBS 203.75]
MARHARAFCSKEAPELFRNRSQTWLEERQAGEERSVLAPQQGDVLLSSMDPAKFPKHPFFFLAMVQILVYQRRSR